MTPYIALFQSTVTLAIVSGILGGAILTLTLNALDRWMK